MSRSKLLTLVLLTGLAASSTSLAATYTVQQLPGRIFSPASLTIAAGDSVRWVNADTMAHTTTSGGFGAPDGLFDSGNMAPGATFDHTFGAPGTFPYYCDYHSNMAGTITVVAGVTVEMRAGRVFFPASVTINAGETVVWLNVDTMAHTATSGTTGSPDGLFDSGNMAPGATYSHAYPAAGTFPYFCDYHSNMIGDVIVRSGVPTPALIKARKGGSDLVLSWTGGTVPLMLLRGQSRKLLDLTPLPGPVTSPYSDLGAIPGPPSLYVYQVP